MYITQIVLMKINSFCLNKYHQDNPQPVSWTNRTSVKLAHEKKKPYVIKLKKKKGFEYNDNNTRTMG